MFKIFYKLSYPLLASRHVGATGSERRDNRLRRRAARAVAVAAFALVFLSAPHVHADYTITSTVGTDPTDVFGTNNGSTQQDDFAQEFTTGDAGTVTSVTVMMYVLGGPNSITLSIQGESSGIPSGTPINSSSVVIHPSDVTGSCAEHTFTFSSPITLSATSNYFLRFNVSAGSFHYPSDSWVLCGTSPHETGFSSTHLLNSSWNTADETMRVILPITTSGGGGGGDISVASDGTVSGLASFWGSTPIGSWSGVFVRAAYPSEPSYNFPSQNALLYGCSGDCTRPATDNPSANAASIVTGVGDYFVLYYDVHATQSPSQATLANADHYVAMHFDGSVWSLTGNSVSTSSVTHIIVTNPTANQVVATSTALPVGATVSVNASDYVASSTNLHLCIQKATGLVSGIAYASLDPVDDINAANAGCNSGIHIPITGVGVSSPSGTFLATFPGAYIMVSQIETPAFSIFGFNIGVKVLSATTTAFVASTTTFADRLALQRLVDIKQLYEATSSDQILDVCNPTAGIFNVVTCVYSIFVPQGNELALLGLDVSNLSQIGPWGFVGTTMAIVRGDYFSPTDSTALPPIIFNISDMHNAASSLNESVTLDPWAVLASSSILSTATSPKDGKTLRQILEPGWTGFVLFLFGFLTLTELLGISTYAANVEARNERSSAIFRQRRKK